MKINSQGLPASEKFLREREREQEYLKAVQSLLDGQPWSEAKAARYREILVEFGVLELQRKATPDTKVV